MAEKGFANYRKPHSRSFNFNFNRESTETFRMKLKSRPFFTAATSALMLAGVSPSLAQTITTPPYSGKITVTLAGGTCSFILAEGAYELCFNNLQEWIATYAGTATIQTNGGFFWGATGPCDNFPNNITNTVISPAGTGNPATFTFIVTPQQTYCFAEGTQYGASGGGTFTYQYAFPGPIMPTCRMPTAATFSRSGIALKAAR